MVHPLAGHRGCPGRSAPVTSVDARDFVPPSPETDKSPALYPDDVDDSLPTAGVAFEFLLLHRWCILWQFISALPQDGPGYSTSVCSGISPDFQSQASCRSWTQKTGPLVPE